MPLILSGPTLVCTCRCAPWVELRSLCRTRWIRRTEPLALVLSRHQMSWHSTTGGPAPLHHRTAHVSTQLMYIVREQSFRCSLLIFSSSYNITSSPRPCWIGIVTRALSTYLIYQFNYICGATMHPVQ